MELNYGQIKQIVEQPTNKATIVKAIRHQDRLRFHGEPTLDSSELKGAYIDFASWVRGLIPEDKYNIFMQLFQLPSMNVELCEKMYAELERVFDGRDKMFDYQFSDSALLDDWNWYKTYALHSPDVWREIGWQKMRSSINSILVVDISREQTTSRPQPYFYWLEIADVIDYQCHGKMDYLIFRHKDKIVVLDDKYYRVYATDKDGKLGALELEKAHTLGYTPARFFWTTPISMENKDIKKSPLTAQLGNLDWLLFFSISKKHLDLYAPYPIYSAYQADCTYRNNETGDYCDGGFLRNSKHNTWLLGGDGKPMACPICSDKRISGAGSFIEVPAPRDKNDVDLSDPVKITAIDKNSLEYNVSECDRLASKIFDSVTGGVGDMQKQSINELQVKANFEAKKSILMSIKTNFELAQRWVEETICRLRYEESFIDLHINWGTEFYLYSVSDLQEAYKVEKESGASESRLDMIENSIIETENRNNPLQMQRMLILKQLEPFRHRSYQELKEMNEKGIVDDVTMYIKMNFSGLIDRFERENINVIEFASNLSFENKITNIYNQLLSYAKEKYNDA